MNRNVNSRFAVNPTRIDMSRSKFDRSASVKTSFNVGRVIPFFWDEVLPGDTFNIDTSKVVRLQTLLTPMMDNLYLDTYFFFVPNRLVWEHWKQFNGENTESAWIPQTEYEVPQIEAPEGGWNVGTIADYLGLPTGVEGISVMSLPFRAYALIMNEWFRDQNLQDPLVVPVDDTTQIGVNTGTFLTDVANGGLPYIAGKYRDYFTSCLPSPQKGPDVSIPVAQSGAIPVYSINERIPSTLPTGYTGDNVRFNPGKMFGPTFGDVLKASNSNTSLLMTYDDDVSATPQKFDNLWAIPSDVGITGQAATINQLRLAFQVQKLLERDARSGSRYIEVIKSHFGVTSPDARMQRPEYLGGNRVPINVNQVVQQSATTSGSTPQGNVAGMSLTTDKHSEFTKSFTEHGIIMGLMVARYDHTYQQGIERMWSRKTRFDYYWPVFANIGEQAVLNKEIFAQGTEQDEEVFGYQEAWADYRYKPSRVTGEMRSAAPQSLDVWHLADDYASLPSLSDEWIREDANNVDRVLAVTSEVSNQMFADIYVRNIVTRPMPMYSVPGLIDHH